MCYNNSRANYARNLGSCLGCMNPVGEYAALRRFTHNLHQSRVFGCCSLPDHGNCSANATEPLFLLMALGSTVQPSHGRYSPVTRPSFVFRARQTACTGMLPIALEPIVVLTVYRLSPYIAFAIIVAEITKLNANSTNFLCLVFTEGKIANS